MLPRGIVLLAALAASAPVGGKGVEIPQPASSRSLPVGFLANRGQWPEDFQFGMRGPTRTLLSRDGWTFCLERWGGSDPGSRERRGAVVRMTFLSSDPSVLQGEGPLPGRHHFLLGNDPEGWVSDVPGFQRVLYRELYPGIDLRVRPLGDAGGLFEYDLLLQPGADLERAVVRCDGVAGLELDRGGSLVMHIDVGGRLVALTQKPPVSWAQRVDGSRKLVPSRFVILGPRTFGFAVEGWDRSEPLILDPGMVWSTYLGGGSSDSANAVHWRSGDGVLAGGWTGSMDFPTVPGAFRETGMRDAFVSRVSEDGETLVFSTYLGGSQGEEVRALGVGPGGAVVVAGWTGSPDFPITPGAFQPGFGGASPLVSIGDGFVARLSADGSRLLQSSFLGGDQDEVVEALHVDERGGLVVVGQTGSIDFPTTSGAVQSDLSSPEVIADGFVSGVAADGRLRFSTYVGGGDWDELNAVDVSSDGITTAVGYTASSNFPTTPNSFQSLRRGLTDAVVVQLDAAGTKLLWSTYLGGSEAEQARAVHVAGDGSVLVGGFTSSSNFPVTSGVLQPVSSGSEDGFLVRMAPDGDAVLWGTFLGGEGDDGVEDLAVDALGDIGVVGRTSSRRFPVSGAAPQRGFGGGTTDGFLVRIDGAARQLAFATYHGGAAADQLTSLSVSEDGFATVSGWTWSQDLGVSPGVLQEASAGTQDALLARLDLVPEPGWVEIEGLETDGSSLFEPGDRFVATAVRLNNASPELAFLETLRVLVAGVGDNSMDLAQIRLYSDRNEDGRVDAMDLLVAGPQAFPSDNVPTELAVGGLSFASGSTAQLLVELESSPGCQAGAEFVAVVAGLDAWSLRTSRMRKLRTRGEARLQGQVRACEAFRPFAGDRNGDGGLDVIDLRGLASQLGEGAVDVDPDGDGVITEVDLKLLASRLLTRPILVAVPGEVSAPGSLTLQGHGLTEGAVRADLGGQGLELLAATDRELVFGIGPGTQLGAQELLVRVGTIGLSPRVVTVR